MSSKRVEIVLIDPNHRLYIYSKKSVLRKRVNGRWMSIVVTRHPSEMLSSNIINDDIKQKIKKIVEQIK
jgi:hypothetical protein